MTDQIRTAVWGTGNVGRAAIRAVDAHPDLELTAVIVHNPDKVGRDAGDLADLGRTLGVAATDDIDGALGGIDALVYAASGEIRPDDALADICKAIRVGATVVTPSLYAMYDPASAPPELRDPVLAAIADGGGSLFVSGIDPGWGNDILPVLVSGLASTIDQVRCQEIFDYTTYDQPDSVRFLVGMGQPMDEEPPMVAPTIPTMVWGGQLRLIARALGVELDDIVETVDRRALDETVENAAMGTFEKGTQGALRFEVHRHRRRRAEDRRRAHHPHPPGVRTRLAVTSRRRRRRTPRDHRGPAADRGQHRGHRRGRQPGCRRQRHGGGPPRQRHPTGCGPPAPASTTPSTYRSARASASSHDWRPHDHRRT